MPDGSATAPFSQRLLRALLGAWVGSAGGVFIVGAHQALQGLPLLATSGLLFPLALFLGGSLGLLAAILHPGSRLAPLSEVLESQRARLRLLLGAPLLVLAALIIGHLAVRLLGAFPGRAGVGGVLLATASLGTLVLGATGLDRAARLLARRWSPPSVRATLVISAGVVCLGAFSLVLVGTTSGTGSPVALFGVLRRPELDLSPVIHLALLAVGGYLGAYVSLKQRLGLLVGALAVVLTAGGFAMIQARGLSFRDAVAMQRAGGLMKMALGVARGVSDRDGDGFSAEFGGGDCDDANPTVHPGAQDVPENGIDEDCRGGDRKRPEAKEDSPEEPQAPAAKIPDDANLLLLTIDTLRWDLGYTRGSEGGKLSPHLDALAARSTTYENAYALASYTSKSLGPMMIGRYPSETQRTFEHFDRFSKNVPFIQERLQQAGVHTRSIQGYWYFYFPGYGFERGWDVLDSSSAPKSIAIEGDKTSNGEKLADRTIESLEALKDSEKPFFLWTHWVDPHSEYVPHEGFDFGSEPRERYDGEVAFVDAQIGRILESLKATGLDDETVIVVTSDHGEAFGEHGMIRHGFEVWDVLMRVPLIVHVPDAPPRRVEVRRSFLDIAPTILETFGVERPSSDDDFVRGTSLYRDVLAKPDAELEQRPVLVDMPKGPHNQQRQAFYDGDWKLITSSGRVLGLYNLATDPGETKDLSDDEDRVKEVQAKMDAFLDQLMPVAAN